MYIVKLIQKSLLSNFSQNRFSIYLILMRTSFRMGSRISTVLSLSALDNITSLMHLNMCFQALEKYINYSNLPPYRSCHFSQYSKSYIFLLAYLTKSTPQYDSERSITYSLISYKQYTVDILGFDISTICSYQINQGDIIIIQPCSYIRVLVHSQPLLF